MDYPINALGFSHKFMAEHIKCGSVCIDATAGKGRDTAFLCGLVGPEGRVTAFDIQLQAVDMTKALLQKEGLSDRAVVVNDCHSNIGRYFEKESCDGIMFNLGWLPDGNHDIFSKPETTVAAIESALEILKPGGVMSVCIYCGKNNGYEEKNRLLDYFKEVDSKRFNVMIIDFPNRRGDFPIPVLIIKNE